MDDTLVLGREIILSGRAFFVAKHPEETDGEKREGFYVSNIREGKGACGVWRVPEDSGVPRVVCRQIYAGGSDEDAEACKQTLLFVRECKSDGNLGAVFLSGI